MTRSRPFKIVIPAAAPESKNNPPRNVVPAPEPGPLNMYWTHVLRGRRHDCGKTTTSHLARAGLMAFGLAAMWLTPWLVNQSRKDKP